MENTTRLSEIGTIESLWNLDTVILWGAEVRVA